MIWEEIDTEEHTYTDRLDVPGGWVYRTRVYKDDGNDVSDTIVAVAVCFVPDKGENSDD